MRTENEQTENFHILIVDDEPDFLRTLVERMKMRHLDVEGVGNGEEALRLLEDRPKDVVVLDVRMPGKDGMETLRDIKQRYPLVEVIMLTGHADVEVAIRGMEFGAFDYLLKPIEIDQLIYKIQDAFKRKSLQDLKIRQKADQFGKIDGGMNPD